MPRRRLSRRSASTTRDPAYELTLTFSSSVKSNAGAEQTQEAEVVAPGPSLVLSEILGRLADATNCTLIDQAAIDFAYVNSKAARKRLIKVRTRLFAHRLGLTRGFLKIVLDDFTIETYRPFAVLWPIGRYY